MVSQESTIDFALAYEGEALSGHTMDVHDLAPSLFALGELFTRANGILNGESVSVNLKVRATQPGSFELILILGQAYQSATQFLTDDLVTSAANLLALTIGVPVVGNSLFSLYKKLKGQKPSEIEEGPDMVTIKIGNVEVSIPPEVFKLYKDSEIKRLSQLVVEPLYRTGIDKMVIKEGSKPLETINKEDAPSFTTIDLPSDSGIENVIPRLALRVISPTFDIKKAKWRLNDGNGTKWYSIEDEKFLREVNERRRVFGMGDYLICRVKITQHMTPERLDVERAILLVLEHQKPGYQPPLM